MSATVFERVESLLQQHQIAYRVLRHEPVHTSEEAARVRGTPLSSGAKSLIFRLTSGRMSDKMSDMKPPATSRKPRSRSALPRSFTLRDLNRQPARVLAACDLHGAVQIQTRDGRSYSLKAEAPPPPRTAQVETLVASRQRLRQRLQAAGFVPPSPAEIERINRIIAGEE
jgi:hypothetical protein